MSSVRAQQAAEAVRYRLRRVDDLGGRLAASIQEWGSEATPRVAVHEDRRGWDVHVDHPTDQTTDEWTYLYSEAIHHLRSALDNMVWALSEPSNLTAGQQRKIAFPILAAEAQWPNAAKGSVRSVPQNFVDRIFEAQPFHAQRPSTSPLAGLQDVNNADKHRLRVRAAVSDGPLGINARFTWRGEAFGLFDPGQPEPQLARHHWLPGTSLHHTVRTRDQFTRLTVTPMTRLFAVAETPDGTVGLTESLALYLTSVANVCQWVTGEKIIPGEGRLAPL